MIRQLAHACFVVRDLEKSLAFYRDVLGLVEAFDFVRDGKRFGVYLHVGGRNFIELFEGDAGGKPGEGGGSFQHICLEVDDIAATVETIRARGVEVSEPRLGSDSSWQAWITDPDGNRIELHAYTDKSRQTPHLQ